MAKNGFPMVSIDGGIPTAGGFIREYTMYQWMRSGGRPISGNLHITLGFEDRSDIHDEIIVGYQ